PPRRCRRPKAPSTSQRRAAVGRVGPGWSRLGTRSDPRRAFQRTVQDLLGHQSGETTQIYTPVMQKPGLGVRSPLDGLTSAR
ncbi:MAG: hypothetical protein ABIV50_05025, partial [Opitutus sp.]